MKRLDNMFSGLRDTVPKGSVPPVTGAAGCAGARACGRADSRVKALAGLLAVVLMALAAFAAPAAYADDVRLMAGDDDSAGATLTVKPEKATKLENGRTYIFYALVGQKTAMSAQQKSGGYDGLAGAAFTLSDDGTQATFASATAAESVKFTAVATSTEGQFHLMNGTSSLTRDYGHLRLTANEESFGVFAFSGSKLTELSTSDSYQSIMWSDSDKSFHGIMNGNGIVYALEVVESAASYAVNFESNGGTAVASQTVDAGGKADAPADPTREGYNFAGWYKDAGLTEAWNFGDDAVNAVTTLYAKWESATGEAPTVRVMRVFKFVPGKTYVIVDSGKQRALSTAVSAGAAQYGNARAGKAVTWAGDAASVTFANLEDKNASLWTAESAGEDGHVKLRNGAEGDYLGTSYGAIHFPAATSTTTTTDEDGNEVTEIKVTDNLGFYVSDNDYVLTDQSNDKTSYAVSYSASFQGFMAQTSKSSAYVYQVLAEGETHEHQLVKRDAVAPTCEAAGSQEYWECGTCGEKFSDDQGATSIAKPAAVPAIGHEWGPWVKVDDDTHSRVCAHDASHVETAAHNWDAGTVTAAPTADAEGVMTYTCADCGATRTEPIAKATGTCADPGSGSASYLVKVSPATSLSAGKRYIVLSSDNQYAMTSVNKKSTYGNNYLSAAEVGYRADDGVVAFASSVDAARSTWACAGVDFFTFSQAGKYLFGNWAYLFCDDPADHDGKRGTTFSFEVDSSTGLAKLYESDYESYRVGYDAGNAAFSASGDKACIVYEVVGTLGLVSATSHDLVRTAAHDAACEEPGNTEYYTCSKCGKFFSDAAGEHEVKLADTVVPAKGHTLEGRAAVAATCEEPGNSAYYECTACGKFFSDAAGTSEVADGSWTVEALGHDYDEGVVTTPATCEKAGERTYTCRHDENHFYTEEIPATGHNFREAATVPPTCEGEGYVLYRCTSCGQEEKRDVKPALGHSWDDGIVTKDPTATAEGEKTFTCTVCFETKVEAVAKLSASEAGASAGASDKKANPLSVKAKAVKAKAKKKTAVKAAKAFKVSGAQGKVTYKKLSGNKKIKVAGNGKVTVKKGLKKGKTYKVKVRVSAAGNASYAAGTKTVTLKVKVK